MKKRWRAILIGFVVFVFFSSTLPVMAGTALLGLISMTFRGGKEAG